MNQMTPMIPPVPNHSGNPQNGQAYMPFHPGPAIGELISVTSTLGMPRGPFDDPGEVAECTYVGTAGIARATTQGIRVVRFDDVPYVLEMPETIYGDADRNVNSWTFMNGWYQPMMQTTHKYFGPKAELQHAKHWIPKLLEQMKAQPPLKIWGAQPRYVALTEEWVEVQQLGRVDRVAPTDVEVAWDAGDLVLRANAFYEARFIVGETPNATILALLLKVLGAR